MKNQQVFKSSEGKNSILAFYDTILEKWPLAYETVNIPTRHGNTFIIGCGEPTAPPLILLHGSSSNSAMWIGDAAEYCRHYRVYAIDIPGEPGKSEAVRSDLNGPAYTEWLNDIFNVLNLKKATIIGISLGGWMALKFSTAYPEKIDKLVLLCPSGVAPQKLSFMLRALQLMFLGKRGTDRLIRIVNGNADVPGEAIAYSRLIADNFNPRVEFVPIFSDEELKRLSMPVLLIAGEKDVLLNSKKTTARLEKLLPRLKVNILSGAGHVLINLAGKIIEFLL